MKQNYKNNDKIKALFDAKLWEKAKVLVLQELRARPRDISLLSKLLRAYYELDEYEHAVRVGRRVCRSGAGNPDVFWDFAYSLFMTGKYQDGLLLFKKLIWLKSGVNGYLKNACRYMIARCYLHLNKFRYAARWLKDYLSCVKSDGEPYSQKAVKETLKEIEISLTGVSAKSILWQALLEIKAVDEKAKFKQAFTNGVVLAKTTKSAVTMFRKELAALGYHLEMVENWQTFKLSRFRYDIPKDQKLAADYALASHRPGFGTFFTW